MRTVKVKYHRCRSVSACENRDVTVTRIPLVTASEE
jgi:hypothetical protein